jgi:kinase
MLRAVTAPLARVASSAAAGPRAAALRLERALPHEGVGMVVHLMERDKARHARGLLNGSSVVSGVVDFPMEGSANPHLVLGGLGYVVGMVTRGSLKIS